MLGRSPFTTLLLVLALAGYPFDIAAQGCMGSDASPSMGDVVRGTALGAAIGTAVGGVAGVGVGYLLDGGEDAVVPLLLGTVGAAVGYPVGGAIGAREAAETRGQALTRPDPPGVGGHRGGDRRGHPRGVQRGTDGADRR